MTLTLCRKVQCVIRDWEQIIQNPLTIPRLPITSPRFAFVNFAFEEPPAQVKSERFGGSWDMCVVTNPRRNLKVHSLLWKMGEVNQPGVESSSFR